MNFKMPSNTRWNTSAFCFCFFYGTFIFFFVGLVGSQYKSCSFSCSSRSFSFCFRMAFCFLLCTLLSLWQTCLAIYYPIRLLPDFFGVASTHALHLPLFSLVLLLLGECDFSSLSVVSCCCSHYISFVLF